MSLRTQAIRGVFWSSIQNWGSALLGTVVFIVLARLLDPQAFGLLALAAVAVNFMEIFLRQGFGQAIVQRQDIEPEHLNSAFWLSLNLAVVLTVGAIFGAGLVAAAFGEPELAPVIRWLSITLVLGALNATPQAILTRDMRFRSLAIRSLLSVGGGGVVGITMALQGYGVWSLVGQHVTAGAIGTIVLWSASGFRPGLAVSRRHLSDLFGFGVYILGAEFLGFLNQRLDRVLIGLFLGTAAVGYYHVAQRLLTVITQVLTQSVSSVSFSTFSKLQHDREQMRNAFLTATRLTAAVAVPAYLGMAVLAPELVAVLFDKGWERSIPVMRVLAFIGILHSVGPFNGIVIMASGKPHWRLWIMLLNSVVNLTVFLIVVPWGIVAVAAAFVIRGYLLYPLPILAVKRLTHISTGDYLKRFVAPVIGSTIMVGCVAAAKYLLDGAVFVHIQLAAAIIVGIVTYTLTIRVGAPELVATIKELIRTALLGAEAKGAQDARAGRS